MKTYIYLLVMTLSLLISGDVLSQGSVGIGTTNPDNSAILEMESTDKGMLIPRMDSLQRVTITSPAQGLMVYETNTKSIWMWNGSIWENTTRPDAIYSEDLGTNVKVYNSGLISMFSKTDAAIMINKNANNDITIDVGGATNSTFLGRWAGINLTSGNDNTGIGSEVMSVGYSGFQNTGIGSRALNRNTGHYNTAVGAYSMDSNKNGWRNTAIGHGSLQFLDSTDYNIAVGADALRFHKNGDNNIAIGFEAAERDTFGVDNISIGRASASQNEGNRIIAMGKNALQNNLSDDNLAIGNESMKNNTSGSGNLAIGYKSMNLNTSGSTNLAVGEGALQNNVSGSNNMAIGRNAGQNETGSNKLYIENSSSTTPLIYGDFANDTVKIYGTLGIKDAYSFPDTNGTMGQVLTANTFLSNQMQWKDPVRSLKDLYDVYSVVPLEQNLLGGSGLIQTSLANATQNTSWGHYALNNLLTGDNNVAVGQGVLYHNKSGSGNTAMGAEADRENISGNHNTVIGYQGNNNNNGGSDNTIIGCRAGLSFQIHSKSGNVLIGKEAGLGDTTDNKLYIDNSGTATPLIWGDFANDAVKIYGSLSIKDQYSFPVVDGTNGQIIQTDGNGILSWATPNNTTKIDDLSDAIQNNNNVFVGPFSGASNTGNYNTSLGTYALKSNIGGSINIAIGDSSLNKNTYGSNNIAIGKGSLKGILSGSDNIAIGQNALSKAKIGGRNLAMGHFALENMGNGTSNSAVGYGALKTSEGDFNTAMGDRALTNSSADRNSAFGTNAGLKLISGKENTLVGSEAMSNNKTGNNNSIFGYQAFYVDTIGSSNTIMGSEALFLSQAASNNTIVGYQAGYNTMGTGNVLLGYKAGYNEAGANTLYIDNSDTIYPLIYGDFVGDSIKINGTLTSEQNLVAENDLYVEGKANFKDELFVKSNSDFHFLRIDSTSISTAPSFYGTQDLWLQTAQFISSAGDVRMPNTSNLGIGTTSSPTHALTIEDVNSETVRLIGPGTNGAESRLNFGDVDYVYIDEPSDDIMRIQANRIGMRREAATNELELEGDASKTTAGNWMANSDRRIKTNIQNIENSFDLMKQLEPVTFNYTKEWKKAHPSIENRPYFNFIAQDYGKVFPYALQGSGEYLPGDEAEILQIDTYDAQIVTIQAVKDLITENEALKQEIDLMKSNMANLKAELVSMINEVKSTKIND